MLYLMLLVTHHSIPRPPELLDSTLPHPPLPLPAPLCLFVCQVTHLPNPNFDVNPLALYQSAAPCCTALHCMPQPLSSHSSEALAIACYSAPSTVCHRLALAPVRQVISQCAFDFNFHLSSHNCLSISSCS